MKERICMTKKCPLRRIKKDTKQLFCLMAENKEGVFLQEVMAVKETQCISRRSIARRILQ